MTLIFIPNQVNRGLPEDQQVPIFPYSLFYVYYEQYLTMWKDALFSLGISVASIFVVTFLLLGLDIVAASIIIVVIIMIVVDLMGIMYWWNIQLNGVTLMNLVVAIGISVEFCAHITRTFVVTVQRSRLERSRKTLVTMGSSVRTKSPGSADSRHTLDILS